MTSPREQVGGAGFPCGPGGGGWAACGLSLGPAAGSGPAQGAPRITHHPTTYSVGFPACQILHSLSVSAPTCVVHSFTSRTFHLLWTELCTEMCQQDGTGPALPEGGEAAAKPLLWEVPSVLLPMSLVVSVPHVPSRCLCSVSPEPWPGYSRHPRCLDSGLPASHPHVPPTLPSPPSKFRSLFILKHKPL